MPVTNLQVAATHAQLMQRSLGGRVIALPGTRDIYLLSTWLHHPPRREVWAVFDHLHFGTPVDLRREPENDHDALAIVVYTGQGTKLGYIPEFQNKVLARLMDAGKYLKGVIRAKTTSPTGLPGVRIRIYMQNL